MIVNQMNFILEKMIPSLIPKSNFIQFLF